MENFSIPHAHCTESETHNVCVDYAMQGIFTDSLMPCNFMHASSGLPPNVKLLFSYDTKE